MMLNIHSISYGTNLTMPYTALLVMQRIRSVSQIIDISYFIQDPSSFRRKPSQSTSIRPNRVSNPSCYASSSTYVVPSLSS